jgi:hypothetical protein
MEVLFLMINARFQSSNTRARRIIFDIQRSDNMLIEETRNGGDLKLLNLNMTQTDNCNIVVFLRCPPEIHNQFIQVSQNQSLNDTWMKQGSKCSLNNHRHHSESDVHIISMALLNTTFQVNVKLLLNY